MLSFARRQDLLRHATDPAGGVFYRNHYGLAHGDGPMRIESERAWQSLSPVTKDDLLACPLGSRSFLPLGRLDHLRASSGTSGKPPLFSPRTHVRNMEYRLSYHDFTQPFMSYTVPMMPHWHERFQREHGGNPLVVCYDPAAPEISARLAKIAGVTGLSLFVYHVQKAGEALKREGIAAQIRFVEITGEVCTRALFDYMRATFPNATIVQSYNSSEVEDAHIGMPCKPLDGTEPLAVYHAKDSHYLELIDAHGTLLEAVEGAEGDLLVTAYPGEPCALPLIRFRIGDTVRIVERTCPHGGFSFTVLGRTEMDFLKVAGGVLRADEIARVLGLYPDLVSDRFSLHCEEVASQSGPLLSPVLSFEYRGSFDEERLARDIERQLRINPSYTWAMGVAEKRFLPLSIRPLDTTNSGGKHRRIVVT